MSHTRIKCALIFVIFLSCQKKIISDRYPYHKGFANIHWGTSSARIDSLTRSDSTFSKVSAVGNSKTRGTIVVVRHGRLDYYLEFNDRDQLCSINYIAEKDHKGNLDSAKVELERNYGPPDKIDNNGLTYENRIWNVNTDSLKLEVQLLITEKSYSLKVVNKNFLK